MFVFGGLDRHSCEVFDSTANKFTLLKESTPDYLRLPSGVISIGNKIFVLSENRKILTYDFEKNQWLVKSCEATKDLKSFSCVKIPV